MIVHIPTKQYFENRKEAKTKLGHSNYNKSWRNGDIMVITPRDKNDIIY